MPIESYIAVAVAHLGYGYSDIDLDLRRRGTLVELARIKGIVWDVHRKQAAGSATTQEKAG